MLLMIMYPRMSIIDPELSIKFKSGIPKASKFGPRASVFLKMKLSWWYPYPFKISRPAISPVIYRAKNAFDGYITLTKARRLINCIALIKPHSYCSEPPSNMVTKRFPPVNA
jgi:hypothetical protein